MQEFIFENSTKMYFGQGCVKKYLHHLLQQHGNCVLLAYGGGSIKQNGICEEVSTVLQEAGKTIVEFSGIMSNPAYAKVQEGAALVRAHQVDLILSLRRRILKRPWSEPWRGSMGLLIACQAPK